MTTVASAANARAEIGVFGGSGFYELLETAREVEVETPFGPPASPLMVGEVGGRTVAFLPRHGRHHELPPHMINYRANVWAMHALGVGQIIAPCAAGSLKTEIEPGHFVVCDQVVDRTAARKDTFYDGPGATHISSAYPYCPQMRAVATEEGGRLGLPLHDKGTVVVVQGPRFSTVAESRWYSQMDWDVINMTQFPEVVLARELALCYVNISLITDYDAGVKEYSFATSHDMLEMFAAGNTSLKELVFAMIPKLPSSRDCICSHALDGASA